MPTGLFDMLDWFLDSALEALLFTFVLVCICRGVRQVSSASARHCVLAATLLFCVAAPVVPLIESLWQESPSTTMSKELSWLGDITPLWQQCFQDLFAGRVPLVYSITLLVVVIWVIGAIAMLAKRVWHLSVAEYESWKLRKHSQKISFSSALLEELNHYRQCSTDLFVVAVPNRVSASVQGLFFPVITVPSDFESLPQSQQVHVLLHEIAHLQRKDLWTSELAYVATSLYWIVPFVWWTARRLRTEAERCCDDLVLKKGVRASDYAETLIAAFDRQTGPSAVNKIALPAIPSRKFIQCTESSEKRLRVSNAVSCFHERLVSIIDPSLPRTTNRLLIAVFLGCTLLLGTGVARSNLIARSLAPVGTLTIRVAINSTSDDAEEFCSQGARNNSQGKVFLSNRDLELGYDIAHSAYQVMGLRFTDIDIPYRAKIEKANIIFVADSEGVGSKVELIIRCEQSAFPSTFHVFPRNISERVEDTLNYISWVITEPWKDGEITPASITPDLTSLVQELVSLPDWKRGQNMVFVFKPTDESCKDEFYRDGISFDSERDANGLQAPVLQITYTAW